MGFSVSGSAAIIFIGVIVAAGIALPPLVGSFGSLAGAQSGQIDRGVDALNTEFEIELAEYDDAANELKLEVENTGSTSLAVDGVDILLDGVIPEQTGVTTEIGGDQTVELWLPGERLTVTVDTETKPERVKLVTENGIAETRQGDGIGDANP